MHVFGGYLGDTSYNAYIPYLWFDTDNEEYVAANSNIDVIFKTNFVDFYGNNISMSLGNYLSLIASIITIVAIVLICCALIKKIYNMCAHVIG